MSHLVELARRLWCAHVNLVNLKGWAKSGADEVRTAPSGTHQQDDALVRHRRIESLMVKAEKDLEAAEKELREVARS